SSATLTVITAPFFTIQPQSRTNIVGTAATFFASPSGASPLSYQWQLNGVAIPSATATNLLLNNVQSSDAGNYTLVASNSAGAVTSSVASLTVLVPPSIISQPQSRTNLAGTTASFSASATGTSPM